MDDKIFAPGPTPNTVRAADGRVVVVPVGWTLLPPGDAGLTRRVKAAGEDWVVQGGDPKGTGTGGDRVPSEYNDLSFKLGSVGIARGQDPAFNNDSQFFIVKKDSTFLDKQYTNFGIVTDGMDAAANVQIGDKIKTITVE